MNPRLGIAAVSAAVLAIALLAAGLGGDGGADIVRVAYLPSVSHAIPIVGLENGAFAAALGNSTQIRPLLLDSGTQAVQSLLSGSLDLAYVGPGPAINAFVRSDEQNIMILSGAASGGVSLVARAGSGISGPADLDGARVAVPQIANTQDISLRFYLAENDLAPAERGGSVEVIAVAGPEMYTLLSRGTVDAAWVQEPWATLLVESLGAVRLLQEEDLWPDSQFSSVVLAARADYAASHPGTIAAWLGAHEATAGWIRANPECAAAAYAAFAEQEAIAELPPGILEASFDNVEITTDLLEPSILEFAERASALGYLGRGEAPIGGIFYRGGGAP